MACLLFFAVPAYRQAFQIAVAPQWQGLISVLFGERAYHGPLSYSARVAEQARKSHDAEGLAFAAAHHWTPDSAGLAEEAVRLDPKLTWIYAFVGNRNWIVNRGWPASEIEGVSKLEHFDPQNALPHLILAQQAVGGKYSGAEMSNPAWQNAMAAAFASSKLDTYGDRLKELDHKVALRYGLDDPQEAGREYEGDSVRSGTLAAAGSPDDYAKLLVNAGDALAARGDHRSAARQYLVAAHFGEMVQPREQRSPEGSMRSVIASTLLQGPYHHLAILYEKQGDKEQAQFFADLAARADQVRQDGSVSSWYYRQEVAGGVDTGWNAQLAGLSGIVMFFCAGAVLMCVIVTIARSGSIQPGKLRASSITMALGYGGVFGLLLASITLYLSYRPYAEIVRAYVRDGDPSRLFTLNVFFIHLYGEAFRSFPEYFWTGVITLGVVVLVFMAVRLISQYRHHPLAA